MSNSPTVVWQDQTIDLFQPLQRDNGEQQDQLKLCMLSYQQHQKLIDQYGDDSERIYRELIKLGFSLSDDEIKRLIVPDFNALYLAVEEAYGQPAHYWFEKLAVDVEDSINQLTLLKPLNTLEGELTELNLQLPTVAALDLMQAQKEDDQSMFIRIHCTGLGRDELEQLSVPDWRALDAKVADFLSQTGSFFLTRTK